MQLLASLEDCVHAHATFIHYCSWNMYDWPHQNYRWSVWSLRVAPLPHSWYVKLMCDFGSPTTPAVGRAAVSVLVPARTHARAICAIVRGSCIITLFGMRCIPC